MLYLDSGNFIQALHRMGWFPIGLVEAAKCVSLTAILFLGPLFEAAIAEGAWRDWIRGRGMSEIFGSWIGYRNIVAVRRPSTNPHDLGLHE
jgi:prenyl protein peptidase